MPQPTPAQMHVDRWLTNLSVAYMQDKAAFVAANVFPIVPVVNKSDDILTYPRGAFYRSGQVRPRALGQRPEQAGYVVNQGHYSCVEYGLETTIDDQTRANTDQPADPDADATYFLSEQALINRETLWVQNFFATGVWTTNLVGVSSGPSTNQFLQWDQTNADPIVQVRNQLNVTRSLTGYKPNAAVFGPTAFESFINNASVRDRYKFTRGGVIDADVVASALGIDSVYVAAGVSNIAEEGQADNIGYIADPNSLLLAYAPKNPGLRQPSAGYQFAWTGLLPGADNAMGGVIEKGREERAHTDWVQIRQSLDMQQIAADLGVFMSSCASASWTSNE